MSAPLSSVFIAILGVPVMIIGLIGWVMPIIPGAPLFFVGLAMTIGWHPKGRAWVGRMRDGLKSLAQRCGIWSKSPSDLKAELFKPENNNPSQPSDHVPTDQR